MSSLDQFSKLRRYAWCAAFLLLSLLGIRFADAQNQATSEDAPIGWCCFYPSVDVGMDQLPNSAASILSVCAGGWGMAQAEGTYDFSAFDRQLAYAQQHGLKLALIQEINPVYTPAWLRAKAKASGQSVVSAAGTPGDQPALTSEIFREAQEELVRKFVAHVRQTDTTGTVTCYHPGAEWWFPMHERYNAAEVERFRKWLGERYQTIERLNAAWDGTFTSFTAVPAPPLEMMMSGRQKTGLGPIQSLDDGSKHCSWSTPAATDPTAKPGQDTYAAATPDKSYTVSAWVKTENVRGYGVFLEVAWVGNSGGPPKLIDTGATLRGTHDWTQLSATFPAPKEAGRAWILLKLMGNGTVYWDDVEFREASSQNNAAPNPGMEIGGAQPAAWSLQNWSGGAPLNSQWMRQGGRTGQACLRVTVPETSEQSRPYRNVDAAVYDWSLYWNETAADYINQMSRLVKSCDPTRKTVTYLTFSFAYPAEWDYSQYYAIAPDEVAMRGRDIDEFGLQICSADGDPYRVTACVDLVRKYGKPVWAVDLVDFTSGVQIGYDAMARATQSAIQHGARGIIYCAWHIPSVLDYSFHPRMSPEDIRRMLSDARESVRIMQGMTVSPRAALVQPILSASPNDIEGFKNDFRSFMGWYKLLDESRETFDVVTLREISCGAVKLERYRYILVPDCAYVQEDVVRRLDEYAQHGGRLITAGRFAEKNEIAKALPPSAQSVPRTAIADHGKIYAGNPVRDTHAGNTPPLFIWRTETPETRAARAEGIAVLQKVQASLQQNSDIELFPEDAGVRCAQYTGSHEKAIYLVNWEHEPIPDGRLKLSLPHESSPSTAQPITAQSVEIYADTKPAEVRILDRSVVLPAFRTSCIVKFKLAP